MKNRSLHRAVAAVTILMSSAGWALGSGRLAPRTAPLAPASARNFGPSSNMPYGAQSMDQSAFALGSIVWNVVLVQGNGSIQTQRETWSAAEISNIQAKVSAAKTFWEGMTSTFVPGARLNVDINYVNGGNPVLTGYEPSTDTSEVWINSVMNQLGSYNSTDSFTNVRNFNNDQRNSRGKNWSTTLFVMDNTSASLTSYAYAYYGGPYAILQNNSAGWGPQNFNMVLSHEMGHIFFANDEYYESGSTVNDRGGYLNQANLNAERNADSSRRTPPYTNALMLNNGNYTTHVPYGPSPYSKDMFGFRDTDADGVPDILDTSPVLTGNNAGSDSAARKFVFTGSVSPTTVANQDPLNLYFSNSQSPMTINTITSAFYSLDGGLPVAIGAVDGAFGGYLEDVAFTLNDMVGGAHTIDIYGINSVGNSTNTMHYDFTALPEPAGLALLAASSLLARRRRR